MISNLDDKKLEWLENLSSWEKADFLESYIKYLQKKLAKNNTIYKPVIDFIENEIVE